MTVRIPCMLVAQPLFPNFSSPLSIPPFFLFPGQRRTGGFQKYLRDSILCASCFSLFLFDFRVLVNPRNDQPRRHLLEMLHLAAQLFLLSRRPVPPVLSDVIPSTLFTLPPLIVGRRDVPRPQFSLTAHFFVPFSLREYYPFGSSQAEFDPLLAAL